MQYLTRGASRKARLHTASCSVLYSQVSYTPTRCPGALHCLTGTLLNLFFKGQTDSPCLEGVAKSSRDCVLVPVLLAQRGQSVICHHETTPICEVSLLPCVRCPFPAPHPALARTQTACLLLKFKKKIRKYKRKATGGSDYLCSRQSSSRFKML